MCIVHIYCVVIQLVYVYECSCCFRLFILELLLQHSMSEDKGSQLLSLLGG